MSSDITRFKPASNKEFCYKRVRQDTQDCLADQQIAEVEQQHNQRKSPLTGLQKALIKQLEQHADLQQATSSSVTLKLCGKHPLPKLPAGYYFKGGAARELLRKTLFPDSPSLVLRDYDLVRFAFSSDTHDHELAKRFMEPDYRFGRGVEVSESKDIYFITRDLTVNEVLYHNMHLECSYTAVSDMLAGILRPTSHVTDALGNVQSGVFMKAFRLAAEALVHDIPMRLEGFPKAANTLPFDAALHLDRALAINQTVAQEYIFYAWQWGVLLPEREVPPSLKDVVLHLSQHLARGVSFFRNLPSDMTANSSGSRR